MQSLEELIAKANANSRSGKPHRDLEHQLQVQCVNAFRLKWPSLRYRLFAVPNGGQRNVIVAAKLRAEGVISGVADLILLKPNSRYGALLIEMKTGSGRQSQHQKDWQSDLCSLDEYKYAVCRSVADFLDTVSEYLTT